jgi:hypothetical protein
VSCLVLCLVSCLVSCVLCVSRAHGRYRAGRFPAEVTATSPSLSAPCRATQSVGHATMCAVSDVTVCVRRATEMCGCVCVCVCVARRERERKGQVCAPLLSAWIAGPPLRDMAPATPPAVRAFVHQPSEWAGEAGGVPPCRRWRLAALTITSESSLVMSPCLGTTHPQALVRISIFIIIISIISIISII